MNKLTKHEFEEGVAELLAEGLISEKRAAELLAAGNPADLKYTADWCQHPECQEYDPVFRNDYSGCECGIQKHHYHCSTHKLLLQVG